jgi:hypothetical protein
VAGRIAELLFDSSEEVDSLPFACRLYEANQLLLVADDKVQRAEAPVPQRIWELAFVLKGRNRFSDFPPAREAEA